MKLSEHFTLEELATTSRNEYKAKNLEEAKLHITDLTYLCVDVLEPIRINFGRPVIITSGFRGVSLNSAVGGSKKSQHMLGQAADFSVSGVSLESVWKWIYEKSGISFGQLLLEGRGAIPTWIHISTGTKGQVGTYLNGKYSWL